MNAFRFILLLLLIWILWQFGRRWYQNFLHNSKRILQPKIMVQCDYCGLYLPKDEAYYSDNACYCCEKHKQAAQ